MKAAGYIIMILGVLIWLLGIVLQISNQSQLEKNIILVGQLVFVVGGITQLIIRRKNKRR
ncbi:hypothetical protein [Paenibacillus xylanilyticus]|uniref:Uncharacterized protein n=1 Tax=Paenibacillus xylanilyticus TaxID=248903 RepID=A0A7Y6C5S8_9BACL|nr:hypothetical protein [Paenibacillus xylanilyticus]NUU80059.1 hypothetical protein [Paenibacillus xylanilyticus]